MHVMKQLGSGLPPHVAPPPPPSSHQAHGNPVDAFYAARICASTVLIGEERKKVASCLWPVCLWGEHTNSHLHNLLFAVTTPLKRFNLGMGKKKGNLTGVGMRPLLYSNGTIHHSAFYLPKNWLLKHFCRSLIGNKNTATRQVFKQEGVKWHLGAGMAENLVFKLHIWRAKHLHEWPSTCFFFSSFSSLPNAKHRLVNYRVTKSYFLPWTGPSFLSL